MATEHYRPEIMLGQGKNVPEVVKTLQMTTRANSAA